MVKQTPPENRRIFGSRARSEDGVAEPFRGVGERETKVSIAQWSGLRLISNQECVSVLTESRATLFTSNLGHLRWRGTAGSGYDSCPTKSRIIGVAKDKVSVTIDQTVLAAADADARAAGLNRSEMIERALQHEHLRISLEDYTTHTVPTLNIEAYAEKVYQANRAAGL